ncbi:MAG: hypothetical protein U9O98_08690 [Asgard group archaeon]|nr:hypothetical protein [Asgard group archaeon]
MNKGPLIAVAIHGVIGTIMLVVGAIYYEPLYWSDWLMWFGIIIIGIGLIVLVVAFIKKPGAATGETESKEE